MSSNWIEIEANLLFSLLNLRIGGIANKRNSSAHCYQYLQFGTAEYQHSSHYFLIEIHCGYSVGHI